MLFASLVLPARAEPPIVAKLNLKAPDTNMQGELRFDLGGGPMRGSADLDVLSDPVDPPKRTDDTATRGRFQVRINTEGTYDGGSFGMVKGTADLTGTFTDDSGCTAQVSGKGTFKGSVSGPIGSAEIACQWKEVTFDGCRLKSPQPFAAALHFTFDRTDVIPKLAAKEPESQPTEVGRGGSAWVLFLGLGAAVAGAAFLWRRGKLRSAKPRD